MQRSEGASGRDSQSRWRTSHEELARRLDALSRDDAQRVLERAIRIQAQRHSKDVFTPDQIRRIASELGLDDSVVDRAIREEMASPPARDTHRWLGPARLVERTIANGEASEVANRVMAWLETEEGLRPVARTPDGIRWEPDKHWMTSTRLALGTEGTKSLRGMPQVIHRQISLGPDEHLVELEVDTSRIRNTAVGVGAGVAVAGVVSGVAVAAGVPGGNDLLQFLTAAVPGLAVAAGSMIATARGWLGSVRRGMLRALDGIAHPELYRRASKRRMRWERQKNSGWQQLVGDVVDAIEDLFR